MSLLGRLIDFRNKNSLQNENLAGKWDIYTPHLEDPSGTFFISGFVLVRLRSLCSKKNLGGLDRVV